jgi:hypothetical protein
MELFKDLTWLQQKNKVFDLHNDYNCVSINYDLARRITEIIFESINSKLNKLCLLFEESSIVKFIFFLNKSGDASTINSFYRGRFETSEGLAEYSASGGRYFYIEFEEGDIIEMFAQRVTLFECMSIPKSP